MQFVNLRQVFLHWFVAYLFLRYTLFCCSCHILLNNINVSQIRYCIRISFIPSALSREQTGISDEIVEETERGK